MIRWLNLLLIVVLVGELAWFGWTKLSPVPDGKEASENVVRFTVDIPEITFQDPYYAEELKDLSEKASTSLDSMLELADALLSGGFYQHAAKHYELVLAEFPTHMPARFKRAFCLDRSGLIAESTAQYEMVTQSQPIDDSEKQLINLATYSIGRNYLRLEDAEKAEQTFLSHKDFLPSQIQLAKLLARSGRPREAIAVLDPLIEEVPFSLELHFWKARSLEQLDDQLGMLEELRLVERGAYLLPSDFRKNIVENIQEKFGFSKRLKQAEKLLEQGNLAGAQKQLDDILKKASTEPLQETQQAIELRGELAMRQQDAQSLSLVAAVMKQRDVNNANTIRFEAAAATVTRNLDLARQKWEQLTRLESSEMAFRNLEQVYTAAGQPELAKQTKLKRLIATGWRYFRENRPEDANKEFLLAIDLDPKSEKAQLGHAEMATYVGDYASAVSAYRLALTVNPYCGPATRAILFLRLRDIAKQESQW